MLSICGVADGGAHLKSCMTNLSVVTMISGVRGMANDLVLLKWICPRVVERDAICCAECT